MSHYDSFDMRVYTKPEAWHADVHCDSNEGCPHGEQPWKRVYTENGWTDGHNNHSDAIPFQTPRRNDIIDE